MPKKKAAKSNSVPAKSAIVMESNVSNPIIIRLKNGTVLGTFRFTEGGVEYLPKNGKIWTKKLDYDRIETVLKIAGS